MQAIVFDSYKTLSETHIVRETTGRRVGEMSHKASADRLVKFLNAEHKNGRVAQGHCRGGHACDRERIFSPEMITEEQRAALVLCSEHAVEIDAARRRRMA